MSFYESRRYAEQKRPVLKRIEADRAIWRARRAHHRGRINKLGTAYAVTKEGLVLWFRMRPVLRLVALTARAVSKRQIGAVALAGLAALRMLK